MTDLNKQPHPLFLFFTGVYMQKVFFKKSICLILIILALTLTVSAVSAENTLQDKNFTDIQVQIDEASENSTITLEGNYISQGSAIKINKSITITSKDGATLNANAKSGIFNITNADVTIQNLNLINSKSKYSPAIFTTGDLKIINTTFKNNTVNLPWDKSTPENFDNKPYSAGAVIANGNLEISNSSFINNYATRVAYEYELFYYYTINWGGSIKANRNATIKNSYIENQIECFGLLLINDSSITNSRIIAENTALVENSNFTKCLNLFYSNGDLNINNCIFTKNAGIIIDCWYEGFKIIINNTKFINNSAKDYGSEVYDDENIISSYYSDMYVYNSQFINNAGFGINSMESPVYIENTTFQSQKYIAIYAYSLVCENSKFIKNYSPTGAINVQKNLVMTNCIFEENRECAVVSENKASIDGFNYTGLAVFNNNLKKFNIITITATKSLKTTYKSGKKITIRLVYSESKNPAKFIEFTLKITKGKKTITDYGYTNGKGIDYYDASKLAIGTYKITITDNFGDNTTSTVKISKAKVSVKAPRVTFKVKKSKYFKVTLKAYKKPLKNVKIKVKVKTGKKYKTYNLKTNSKGIVKLNTKNLKVGRHTVIIYSGNSNYKINAKSLITIKRY